MVSRVDPAVGPDCQADRSPEQLQAGRLCRTRRAWRSRPTKPSVRLWSLLRWETQLIDKHFVESGVFVERYVINVRCQLLKRGFNLGATE